MKHLSLVAFILLLLVGINAQSRELSHFESNKLYKVNQLLEKENYAAALRLIQPLFEQQKPHPTVFKYGCKLLTDTEDQTEALSCWTRGYKLYPNDSNLAINLADSLLKSNQYQMVIDVLTPLLVSNSDQSLLVQARYIIGYAYYQLAQYQAVIDMLLISPVKQHWWPLISYSQLALEDWQGAKNSAQQWLKSTPDNLAAWQILAQSEMGLENPIAAAVAMDIARLVNGEKTPVNVSLLGNLKAYNFAAECLSQSKQNQQVFTAQEYTCAQYAWLSGQYQQALDFMQSFVIDSNLSTVLYDDFYLLKGQLFAVLKQNDKAINSWKKVGQQALAIGTATEIKYARQKRNQQQGQALLLMGQHYWLAQQWPEAKACYRKLAQTPGFEPIANAYIQNLIGFGL
ncbi:tetratricopeptide repeat protein [Shewanella phaeophyticola]|uniref:Tetratricopeptide repeat protein n=1 Tax=Shewanella phaeophyticola TaxID=2978345 RepID=A0ABT2P1V5_9GAMM|nr:tetratricopeptide repeat protein [Shewanella sp. KJ10-1]MCT8986639.1 tetratricopeptide repeat protein [Shewanella sp. KJ10-1]